MSSNGYQSDGRADCRFCPMSRRLCMQLAFACILMNFLVIDLELRIIIFISQKLIFKSFIGSGDVLLLQ